MQPESTEHLQAANQGPVSDRWLKWGTILVFLYFGARLVYFALDISSYVPPDEVTHAGICRLFSRVLLLPDNSPESYQFGLVTNIPWLYYWTMGKLLHLNFFGLPDLVFLRLLNAPLAFATVVYSLRLLRLVTQDRLTAILLLIAATNTAMFTFLSASVSYDNLTNLLAVMAIYYLFAFLKDRSGEHLGMSLLCQMLGSLTKVTFLPLVLALNALLLIHEARRLPGLPAAVKERFAASPRRAAAGILLLALAAGLNLQLYGGNYLRYGSLNPSMPTVLSPSAALNYRMEARGMIFRQFKEGKISYMDAVIMAGEINHPGDKADTFYLLMNWQKLQGDPRLWLGPFAYGAFWFQTMVGSIIGIKGHLPMLKDPVYLIPFYVGLALAALGFLLRWRPRESGWLAPALAAVALFYAGFLLREFNYDSYLYYGEPSLTVYGRYLFPVLFPTYVLVCHYLLQLFRSGPVRVAVALAAALLFISYDFPWFVAHATPEWFSWLPR